MPSHLYAFEKPSMIILSISPQQSAGQHRSMIAMRRTFKETRMAPLIPHE